MSQIHGMVFLSTPHKGSNYARTLNNILSAAPTGSPKMYITDLEINSTSLLEINELFRTACGDLTLVSFYESLKTTIGNLKLTVIDCSPSFFDCMLMWADRGKGLWSARLS